MASLKKRSDRGSCPEGKFSKSFPSGIIVWRADSNLSDIVASKADDPIEQRTVTRGTMEACWFWKLRSPGICAIVECRQRFL